VHLGNDFVERPTANPPVLVAVLLDVVMPKLMSKDVAIIPKRNESVIWPRNTNPLLVPCHDSIARLQRATEIRSKAKKSPDDRRHRVKDDNLLAASIATKRLPDLCGASRSQLNARESMEILAGDTLEQAA
jgi:hypothetical protein